MRITGLQPLPPLAPPIYIPIGGGNLLAFPSSILNSNPSLTPPIVGESGGTHLKTAPIQVSQAVIPANIEKTLVLVISAILLLVAIGLIRKR